MTEKEKVFILNQVTNNYHEIMESKDLNIDKKTKLLGYLMSQLEDLFNIPILKKFLDEDKKESPEIKLHTLIANSKNFN